MTDNSKPTTLYKFRSWNDTYHRLLLTEKKLWVPSADKLNDPFDCAIPIRFDQREGVPINMLIKHLSKESPDASNEELTTQARELIKEIEGLNQIVKKVWLQNFTSSLKKELGILSFATTIDNPLLWSHYSDGYKGFCLGFDYVELKTQLEIFLDQENIPFDDNYIQYAKEMPILFPSNEDDPVFIELAMTKSDHWKHEKEYRYVFAGKVDFPLSFPESVVTEIILGSEMPGGDRKLITLLAKSEFPNAKLLQARRKPFSFKLEFEQIK